MYINDIVACIFELHMYYHLYIWFLLSYFLEHSSMRILCSKKNALKTLTEYERMLCYGEKARRFAEELATSDDIKNELIKKNRKRCFYISTLFIVYLTSINI